MSREAGVNMLEVQQLAHHNFFIHRQSSGSYCGDPGGGLDIWNIKTLLFKQETYFHFYFLSNR